MNISENTNQIYEKKGYELFLAYKNYRETYESLTSPDEISFLLGLISQYKFSNGKQIKKCLEIGIYNGVTSLYMLKEGAKKENFHLYSIEKADDDFYGEAVVKESTAEELKHYGLNKGKTVFDIEEVLDSNIELDLVFIDACHVHPHPLIDLIFTIPYLHDESLVVFHDVIDHMLPNNWGASFIYTAWKGKKYRAYNLNQELKPLNKTSLGCIEIPKNKEDLYYNLLEIAKISFKSFRIESWKANKGIYEGHYLGISEEHLIKLQKFMVKHYDETFVNKIISIFQENLTEYDKNWNLLHHEAKYLNFLQENIIELKNTTKYLSNEIKKIEKQVQSQQKLIKSKDKKIKKIETSRSWRFTKFLRVLGKKLK